MTQEKASKQSWQIYLKFDEPVPGCLAVTAESSKVLCYALGRAQERFENEAFKGKNDFTYWDMNDWYKDRFGFNYHDVWSGFNIPVVEAFRPFINEEVVKGNDHEQQLIEAVKKYQPKYIIAYEQGDFKTYKHMLRHAMWHLSSQYRNSCTRLLSRYKAKFPENIEKLEIYLRGMLYTDTVLLDEMQAHIQERPWSTGFKLGNAEMHKYRKAYLRGVNQLNRQLVEETTDVTGTIRLRRKIAKVVVEGMRNKFKKGHGVPNKRSKEK
jgi:hypothetical protein